MYYDYNTFLMTLTEIRYLIKESVITDEETNKRKRIKEIDKTVFYTAVIEKMFSVSKDITVENGKCLELDIYFNPYHENLFFVGDPSTALEDTQFIEDKSRNYDRVGTISDININNMKEIRVVDKDLEIFEFDDGEGMMYNYSEYRHLNKFKIKRTILDSSFGVLSDVKYFYRNMAQELKFLEGIIDKMNELLLSIS